MIEKKWTGYEADRKALAKLKLPLTRAGAAAFRRIIYRYYYENGRRFPWRETVNPYHIHVSEVMLQQTQTDRVIHKYDDFICRFPDYRSLAAASVRDVLDAWVGLGYNRRALALQNSARIIISDHGGMTPQSEQILLQLPGIGKYSASAILAFAYSIPTVFVETNIRSVFTYFFSNGKQMADNRMHDLVAATVDIADPRKWYYALFDYGAMLKKTLPPAQRIKEKKTQAPFHGSDRQIRGAIVRKLISNGNLTEDEIIKDTLIDKDRAGRILDRLQQEGFIARDASSIKLAGG